MADLTLPVLTQSNCGSELARDGGFTVDLNLWEWSDTLLIQEDFSDEFWRLLGGKGSLYSRAVAANSATGLGNLTSKQRKCAPHNVSLRPFSHDSLWRLCAGDLRGLPGSFTLVFQPAYGCHPLAWKRTWQLQPVNGMPHMIKVTPNPPETASTSADVGSDSKEIDEVTERVLNHYLDPKPQPKKKPIPGQLFTVVEGLDSETLLANLSETLASANALLNDLTFDLDGSRRHIASGVQQMIELSELLANRALDIVDPR